MEKDFEGGSASGEASEESECGSFLRSVFVLCDGREREEMESRDKGFYLSSSFTFNEAWDIALSSLHYLPAPAKTRGCKPSALLARGDADRASKDSIEFNVNVHEQGW